MRRNCQFVRMNSRSQFAYAFGLDNAQAHLDALGVEPPELPPYDELLYEPMPDVDIDPED